MSFLSELVAQMKATWSRWSQSQRITIAASIVLSVMSIIGVGYWAMTPQYVVLADHLPPSSTADYVSALESAGISYKLNFAGSSISVPQNLHSQARLEVRDLIDSEIESESDLSGSLWADPAMNQAKLIRQQETRLARTIQQMKPVKTATVHLTQTVASPFVRDQKPAKASVTLELKKGAPFSGSDAASIVSLISHSVEGMSPENVTVLSTDGRLLSSTGTVDGEVSGQLEYRSMLESNLASKAEALLTPLLGIGNATVRVSAEIDFTETERTQKRIDPDSKAKVREEVRTESFTGNNPQPFGPPGTASNVSTPNTTSSRQGQHETEDFTTEYINGETTDLIREHPGRIQRLTVAAVIQIPEIENGTGNETSPADSLLQTTGINQTANQRLSKTVTQEDVEKIIRNAVGFDETRGDEIEVVAARLAPNTISVPQAGFFENLLNYTPILKAISLAVASIVAFFLGLLIVRRLRPVVVERNAVDSLSPEIIERLNSLSEQMKERPEVVTTVLASWLHDEESEHTEHRKAA